MNIYFFLIFSKKKVFNLTIKNKIKYLILSYFLTLLIIVLASFFIKFFDKIIIEKILNHPSISDLFTKSTNKINGYSIFTIVFIVPFLEEIIFRLVLNVNKTNLCIFISFILYLLIGGKILNFSYNNTYHYLYLSICIFFFFLIKKNVPEVVITLLRKNVKSIIIFSIFSFGLIHITNILKFHSIEYSLLMIYPIYVIPQFIMGYFISNLRIKCGFLWGLYLHFIINLIPTLVFIYTK